MVVKASLDHTFAALANPARREIVLQLLNGPARVTDLGQPLNMTQQAVSKHVRVLQDAGLVWRTRAGRERWCELNAAPLEDLHQWLRQHRTFWNQRLDKLDRLLEKRRKGAKPDGS